MTDLNPTEKTVLDCAEQLLTNNSSPYRNVAVHWMVAESDINRDAAIRKLTAQF